MKPPSNKKLAPQNALVVDPHHLNQVHFDYDCKKITNEGYHDLNQVNNIKDLDQESETPPPSFFRPKNRRSNSIVSVSEFIETRAEILTRKRKGSVAYCRANSLKNDPGRMLANLDELTKLTKDPNDENFIFIARLLANLRKSFKESDTLLKDFVDNGFEGIDLLFDLIRKTDEKSSKSNPVRLPSFAKSFLQLESLNCIKAIMESPLGIQKIISNDSNYIDKLVTGN